MTTIHTEAGMIQGARIQYRATFRTMALGGEWCIYRAAPGETLSGVVLCTRAEVPDGAVILVHDVQARSEDQMAVLLSAAIRYGATPRPPEKPATLYFEAGLPATLIPVDFVGWARTPAHDVTGCHNAVIRLKRGAPGYPLGDVLHVPARAVVVKAGRRNYCQLVRPAQLPPLDPAKTIPARS